MNGQQNVKKKKNCLFFVPLLLCIDVWKPKLGKTTKNLNSDIGKPGRSTNTEIPEYRYLIHGNE